METVKIADLKNNLSRHLMFVRSGGELVVLDRARPVARLTPFAPRAGTDGSRTKASDDQTAEVLAGLERDGIVTRGDGRAVAEWAKKHRPVKLPAGSRSAVDVLLEMRGESTR